MNVTYWECNKYIRDNKSNKVIKVEAKIKIKIRS